MSRMLQCLGAETDRQDEVLNRNYEAALSADPGRADALRAAQRAWLKRREGKCRVDLDGGSAAVVEASDCNLTETASRAEELRLLGILSQLGGVPLGDAHHLFGLVACRGELVGYLLLPLLELDPTVRRLLVHRSRPGDQRLFDVMTVRFGLGTRLLDQRRRLPRSIGANVGGLLFGHPEDLLHAEAEALLGLAVVGLPAPVELGARVTQVVGRPLRELLGLLPGMCRGGQLRRERRDAMVDLLLVVATNRGVETPRIGLGLRPRQNRWAHVGLLPYECRNKSGPKL